MNIMPIHQLIAGHVAGRQRGVVLFIALITLVAMTLAGIALVRSIDTGMMIAGNLAFKQGATNASDAAITAAMSYLAPKKTTGDLNSHDQANGYYAIMLSEPDYTGNQTPGVSTDDFNWDDTAKVASPIVDAAGNTVTYVIHRLCTLYLATDPSPWLINDPTVGCYTSAGTTGAGSTKGGASYGAMPLTGTSQVYYRITIRSQGPRNTVSYVQTYVAL